MFCSQCGNEIKEGERFCGKCGALVQSQTQNSMQIPVQPMSWQTGEAGQEQQKERTGRSAAGKKLGAKLGKWMTDYVDTWRGLGKLRNREKYIWLGLHGGMIFLFVFLLNIRSAAPGNNTEDGMNLENFISEMLEGGDINAENLLNEVWEDGDITEKDVLYVAEQIHSYEAWAKLEETYYEKGFLQKAKDAGSHIGLNFPMLVARQCNDMSAMGMLIKEYDEWYDKDGLTERIMEKSDPVKYVGISSNDMYFVPEESVKEDTFRKDGDGNAIDVMCYAYPDSDEITFVKMVYGETTTKECYNGKYEIVEKDLVIKLDGKEYHLSQATTDLASRKEELFSNMVSGTWKFDQGFYDMVSANLGSWEKFSVDARDTKPLYITFNLNNSLLVRGVDGIYLARIKDFDYQQGEGKTVTFTSQSSSMTASYDKRGSDLVITVNGTDYVLSPTTIENTGTYDAFGTRK